MKKRLLDLPNIFYVIRVSIKTIFQIDPWYLALLSLSMAIDGLLPFLNIYFLRNLLNEVFEQRNARNAILNLILFTVVTVAFKWARVLVMWYRSIHYINFGHYFDVINSKKTLSISYQRLQDKKLLI